MNDLQSCHYISCHTQYGCISEELSLVNIICRSDGDVPLGCFQQMKFSESLYEVIIHLPKSNLFSFHMLPML